MVCCIGQCPKIAINIKHDVMFQMIHVKRGRKNGKKMMKFVFDSDKIKIRDSFDKHRGGKFS